MVVESRRRSLRPRAPGARVALCCLLAGVALAAFRSATRLGGSAFVPAAAGTAAPYRPAVAAGAAREPQVARRFFEALLGKQEEKEKLEDVVIREDYTLAGVFSGLGLLLCTALPYAGFGLGALILLLGILFFVQTGRVRFCFDQDSFELRTLGQTAELNKPGENIVVGGENRWAYSSFVNYEFFPKGLVEKGLPPILVYFKETQTPEDQWSVGPGSAANSEKALQEGAVPGMVHFFPAICDTQQIRAEFERRGCKKIISQ